MVVFCVRVSSVVAFCVFLSARVLPPGTRFLLLYQITPEFSSLKQYAFIISQFLWVWNMGVASLDHPALGLSQGCNQRVGHGTDGEASTSKFIQWPLAGCSSLYCIEGLSSLLAIGQRQLSSLPHEPFHRAAYDMGVGFTRVSREEGGSQILAKQCWKGLPGCPIVFIRSELLGQAHTQGRGDYIKAWDHLRSLITSLPSGKSNPPSSMKAHMILVGLMFIIPAIPTHPHTGVAWNSGLVNHHSTSSWLQWLDQEVAMWPKLGQPEAFPDVYIYWNKEIEISLSHLKSLKWNDVTWGFPWPCLLPTL